MEIEGGKHKENSKRERLTLYICHYLLIKYSQRVLECKFLSFNPDFQPSDVQILKCFFFFKNPA